MEKFNSFKRSNNVTINTGLNIECANIKHIAYLENIHIYIYGRYLNNNSYQLIDVLYDLKKDEIVNYYILPQVDVHGIIPSNNKVKNDLIFWNQNEICYCSRQDVGPSVIVENLETIYSKLFWSKINENNLIGLNLENRIEIIDIQKTQAVLSINHSINLKDSIKFEKLIVDLRPIEKSNYENCILSSFYDCSLTLFDLRINSQVNNTKTKEVVHNISLSDDYFKFSCSEIKSNLTYFYDLRKIDNPITIFNIGDAPIKQQLWANRNNLATSTSYNKELIFNNILHSVSSPNINKLSFSNHSILDETIKNFVSSENFLLIEYENYIDIISLKSMLR